MAKRDKSILSGIIICLCLISTSMLYFMAEDSDASAPGFHVINTTVPAEYAQIVTSGATTFNAPTRGLYIGGSGNLVVTMASDNSGVSFQSLIAGTILPIRVSAVRLADSTASNIVALF